MMDCFCDAAASALCCSISRFDRCWSVKDLSASTNSCSTLLRISREISSSLLDKCGSAQASLRSKPASALRAPLSLPAAGLRDGVDATSCRCGETGECRRLGAGAAPGTLGAARPRLPTLSTESSISRSNSDEVPARSCAPSSPSAAGGSPASHSRAPFGGRTRSWRCTSPSSFRRGAAPAGERGHPSATMPCQERTACKAGVEHA
mmetsp:Transcript_92152/g.298378  ORF Transcript_92152/g.298378 Transcript_92152/m.298378 type:complete len:206 (+) Transcript_92152:1005-1622(+)